MALGLNDSFCRGGGFGGSDCSYKNHFQSLRSMIYLPTLIVQEVREKGGWHMQKLLVENRKNINLYHPIVDTVVVLVVHFLVVCVG